MEYTEEFNKFYGSVIEQANNWLIMNGYDYEKHTPKQWEDLLFQCVQQDKLISNERFNKLLVYAL